MKLKLIRATFSDCPDIYRLIEENIRQTLSYVRGRIKEKDLASYDEILFVSKSLGTVSAGWLADALEKEKRVKPGTIRHIFMTPLEQTFPYMRKENCIVISGELDRYLERKKLKKFCKKHEVLWCCFPDVGHSMEHEADVSGVCSRRP